MSRNDPEWSARLACAKVVKDHGITALPVDPIAVAHDVHIEVRPKPASAQGVSGMLLRIGYSFGIAYATHVNSIGFRNFSIAYELGHYFLPGHVDAVLAGGSVHESHAGFASGDCYEMEADHPDRSEFTGLENIVAFAAQPFRQTAPGTMINKEPHDRLMDTADSESLEITACAYAVHARMSSSSSPG